MQSCCAVETSSELGRPAPAGVRRFRDHFVLAILPVSVLLDLGDFLCSKAPPGAWPLYSLASAKPERVFSRCRRLEFN
jgi:hypothetical protein